MLQIGNDKIKEVYVGGQRIKEIYVGSQLVYKLNTGPRRDCIDFYSDESFVWTKTNGSYSWNGSIEVSTSGAAWTVVPSTSTGTLASSQLGADGKHHIYIRGTGNTNLCGYPGGSDGGWLFQNASKVYCDGYFEALLDYKQCKVGSTPNMSPYAFAYLFYNNTSIANAPSLYINSIPGYGFYRAFLGCTNLERGFSIAHVTSIGAYSFRQLYQGCTKLKTICAMPNVPQHYTYSFYYMYRNCSSLNISTNSSVGTNTWSFTQQPTSSSVTNMFSGTTGGVTTPVQNTIYYTSNEII